MRKRSTIEVGALVDQVNKLCSLDTISQQEKHGACQVLESVLHETKNYEGFMYPNFPHELWPLDNASKSAWFVEHEYDRKYFHHSRPKRPYSVDGGK